MAYPSRTSSRSYGGGNLPTYLVGSIPSSYAAGQTFTVADASTWYEIDENGQTTLNPLGFSGPYSGTRHQFLIYGTDRLAVPSNSEYSVPQLKMMLAELEKILGRTISLEEWNNL